jgi:hypothetical protein
MRVASLQERILVFLLRFGGGIMLLAWLTIFLPTEWMSATNRWVGLGEFPDGALTQYLTRSLSLLYAMHGGVLIVASIDVRRFAPLIVYLGSVSIAAGAVLLGIDLHAGMPGSWTWTEGPSIILVGAILLLLLRQVTSECP